MMIKPTSIANCCEETAQGMIARQLMSHILDLPPTKCKSFANAQEIQRHSGRSPGEIPDAVVRAESISAALKGDLETSAGDLPRNGGRHGFRSRSRNSDFSGVFAKEPHSETSCVSMSEGAETAPIMEDASHAMVW
jgi:hypothetical protein